MSTGQKTKASSALLVLWAVTMSAREPLTQDLTILGTPQQSDIRLSVNQSLHGMASWDAAQRSCGVYSWKTTAITLLLLDGEGTRGGNVTVIQNCPISCHGGWHLSSLGGVSGVNDWFAVTSLHCTDWWQLLAWHTCNSILNRAFRINIVLLFAFFPLKQ